MDAAAEAAAEGVHHCLLHMGAQRTAWIASGSALGSCNAGKARTGILDSILSTGILDVCGWQKDEGPVVSLRKHDMLFAEVVDVEHQFAKQQTHRRWTSLNERKHDVYLLQQQLFLLLPLHLPILLHLPHWCCTTCCCN